MARDRCIALHEALDGIAREEGFAGWSLLASRAAANPAADALLPRLSDGDLLLLGARPRQGKTMLGLRLLVDALREKRRAVLFTLEYTEREARERIRALGGDAGELGGRAEIVAVNDIDADLVIRHLAGSARGTVATVDYLQILDQRRTAPSLPEQMLALRNFADETGVVLCFLSQIDRSFDPTTEAVPGIRDVRLPNSIDPALFSKACFLHGGKMRFDAMT